MRLAQLLGVDFRFTWPLRGQVPSDTSHSIVSAEQFFSADFLDAHGVDEAATSGFAFPRGGTNDLHSLRSQLAGAVRGLLAPATPLASRIDPRAVPEVSRGFSAEFSRVGFHPQIQAAIDAARAVPLTVDVVAVHLRAGDHIFGRFRLLNRFWDKTVPAPIGREMIMRSRGDGHDVIVFGQDVALIDELCTSTGAIDATSLRPATPMTRPAEAMFDIVLMSRCARILAGDSGFAVQAAAIGDQEIELHIDVLPADEALQITRTDLARNGARYHPLQRSFAWWVAYHRVRHDIPFAEAAELISAAIEADPENPRARLRLAALSYREGDMARGDDVLIDALVADARPDQTRLQSVMLFSHRYGKVYDNREILDDIEAAAEAGSGPALVYRAAVRAQRGDTDTPLSDAAAFIAYAGGDPRLASVPGLDALVEETIRARLGPPTASSV